MSLWSAITSRVSALNKGQLLVVETDGFTLRAAILSNNASGIVVEALSRSTLLEPEGALEEALEELRLIGPLPKRGILLAPEVVPALVSLPVDPAHARPAKQMQELVRWELEPQVAIHAGARPIGEILIGMGALTHDDVALIIETMEQQRAERGQAAAGQRRPLQRFGEIARGMNLVTAQQVDAALEIQQRFQQSADELICGWTGQPAPAKGAGGKGPGGDLTPSFTWLACGTSSTERIRWKAAFASHEIELLAIYPQLGSAAAAVDPAVAKRIVVLEFQAGMLSATRLVEGRIVGFQTQLTAGRLPTVDLCVDLVGFEPFDRLIVAGRLTGLEDLITRLAERLGVEAQGPAIDCAFLLPKEIHPASLAGVVGAARHAWGLSPQGATSVNARDLAPPFYKRREAWSAAAVVAVMLFLAGWEASLQWRLWSVNQEHAQIQEQLRVIQDQEERQKQLASLVEQLQSDRQLKQQSIERRRKAFAILNEEVPERTRFLPALLEALAAATNEEVSIDRVLENEQHAFQITAWALHEDAAEEFARDVSRRLQPWALTVTSRSLWDQQGRLGLPGFAVDLKVGAAAAEAPVAGLSRTPTKQPSNATRIGEAQ